MQLRLHFEGQARVLPASSAITRSLSVPFSPQASVSLLLEPRGSPWLLAIPSLSVGESLLRILVATPARELISVCCLPRLPFRVKL